jgi:hypothetical protein
MAAVTAMAVLEKAALVVAAAAMAGLEAAAAVLAVAEAGVMAAPAMVAESAKETEEAAELVPAMDMGDQVAARGAKVLAVEQVPARAVAMEPAADSLPTLREKAKLAADPVLAAGRGVAAGMVPDITRLRQPRSYEISRPAVTDRAVRVRFSWKAR